MDPFSIFFLILFFFLVFLPQLAHQSLMRQRLTLIREMEKKRKSRVITLIHRQERIGFFGIPIFKYIDIEDSEEILRAIRMTPDDMPIDIILHTPGGLILASVQIAYALKDHPAKTTVIVPHYAMSGGTLIALAADEIIMDPHAVLGPVDPQIAIGRESVVPAVSIIKAVETKGYTKVDDLTIIKADMAEKAIRQVEETIISLLKDRMEKRKAERIAKILAEGRWTHDYPITPEVAKEIGLPIKIGIPEEVYKLMSLYPQTHQLRPGVEFIPIPYRNERQKT